MRWCKQACIGLTTLLCFDFLHAQRVLYSSFSDFNSVTHFEVAGKAGDYYWVERENQPFSFRRPALTAQEQSFEIYDSRLNPVKTIVTSERKDNELKEYLICSSRYFDRLILTAGPENTVLSLDRYTPDGTALYESSRIVGNFPLSESGNNFLMARSEDQSKLLVLFFQPIPSSPPRIHAILFDSEWQQLDYSQYDHPFLTQPLLQEEVVNYPIENFNNAPLKLANNGQWLMLSPSRINYNYLLFNFNSKSYSKDNGFIFKEIPLPASSVTEDLSLTIDNEKATAMAAVLSKFRYPALKNVEIVRYSFAEKEIDFDSAYRFSTLAGAQLKNENLVHESLIGVPKKGFILLKEYGRTFEPSYDDVLYQNPWDIEALYTNVSVTNIHELPSINRDGYTRLSRLGAIRGIFDRGDLNLFYFPAIKGDSCWSGMINKEQATELNSPYLSYFTLPVNDRIFFFYNSFFGSRGQFGSTTILDDQGNLQTEGGGAFWKFNNTLDFQQSQQISDNEVAIPYANSRRKGFAIIRF
jgi:hypothetical protein